VIFGYENVERGLTVAVILGSTKQSLFPSRPISEYRNVGLKSWRGGGTHPFKRLLSRSSSDVESTKVSTKFDIFPQLKKVWWQLSNAFLAIVYVII